MDDRAALHVYSQLHITKPNVTTNKMGSEPGG